MHGDGRITGLEDPGATTMLLQITNLGSAEDWVMTRSNGETIVLVREGDHLNAELIVDNRAVVVRPY